MMNKAQAYHRQQDPNRLVERYAGLVKRIGQHMLARLPSSVQLDDLLQAGMIDDPKVRKQALDKIQKEVDHMSQLIGDILMISRLTWQKADCFSI